MGYRSNIVLAITKHLTPFLTLATAQNAAAQALVFKDADEFERDYYGDKSWLIRWDSIKWYDSYEEIHILEKFIQEAVADEYEFEVDGKKQNSSEHIRFIRVGEESGDIECSGEGFWDIHTSTAINY